MGLFEDVNKHVVLQSIYGGSILFYRNGLWPLDMCDFVKKIENEKYIIYGKITCIEKGAPFFLPININ